MTVSTDDVSDDDFGDVNKVDGSGDDNVDENDSSADDNKDEDDENRSHFREKKLRKKVSKQHFLKVCMFVVLMI